MRYFYLGRKPDYVKIMGNVILVIVLLGLGLIAGAHLAFDSILDYREIITYPEE